MMVFTPYSPELNPITLLLGRVNTLCEAFSAPLFVFDRYSGFDFPNDSSVLTVNPLLPADNDNLANAIQITTLPYTTANPYPWQTQTLETNEIPPSCAPEGYASVWYQYTPTINQTVSFATDAPILSIWNGTTHPLTEITCNNSMASGSTSFPLDLTASETVRLDTQTSSYDTVLSVWTGRPSQPLTEIACHEDLSTTDSQSKLIVTLTADTTYLINVSGTRNDYYLPISSGNLVLTVTSQ